MVVFCGPTYLTRLWCIVELFTFVHMGGKIENITFEPVLREGHEEEDLLAISRAFDRFDASACSCFVAADKKRMMDIICAAYGGIEAFNEEVRAISRVAG